MGPSRRVHKSGVIYFQHTLLSWGPSDPLAKEKLKRNNPHEELGGRVVASFVFMSQES